MSPEVQVSSRRIAALLVLILLAGLALRVWWADYGLSPTRFWDERYSLEIVRPVLTEGTLEPARGYYPSPVWNLPAAAVLAVSQRAYEATGIPIFATMNESGWEGGAYLWLRLLQCLYSLGALALTFLIGRRLFSSAAGLLATLVLAGMPWHVHAAGVFKPDSLLCLTILLAFWLSLRVVERPTATRALLAGLGIALAMSAKMTGGLVAVPLVVATALLVKQEPRVRLAALAVAGVSSAVLFMAMNPYWRNYPHYLTVLKDDYAMRAGFQGWTRWQVPGRVLAFLLRTTVFGRIVGGVALGAFGLLTFAAVRPGSLAPRRRAELAMVVTFPIVYVVAYMVQTPYFKPNNFLPIVPFLALAAAQVSVSVWGAVRRVWPILDRGSMTAALAASLGLLFLSPGFLYVYDGLYPTTLESAESFVLRGTGFGRQVVEQAFPHETLVKPRRAARILVDAPHEESVARLNYADGEIFLQRMLDGPQADFYRRRMDRVPPERAHVFERRLFGRRGPGLIAIRHPRKELEGGGPLPLSSCGESCWTATLPSGDASGALTSLMVAVAKERANPPPEVPSLSLDGRPRALHYLEPRHSVEIYLSERFEQESAVELRLESSVRQLRPPDVQIRRWHQRRPSSGEGQGDVVGIGKAVEPGKLDPGQDYEGEDQQGEK